MQRLSLNQTTVEALRADAQTGYPGRSEPLPGTALKLDDDVWWLDLVGARVLWGYDTDEYFTAYCPDWFGDALVLLQGVYITDRAPADPEETPMPVYPQQQQQRQGKHDARSKEQQLKDLIKLQPDSAVAKKMREVFKQKGLIKDDDPKGHGK